MTSATQGVPSEAAPRQEPGPVSDSAHDSPLPTPTAPSPAVRRLPAGPARFALGLVLAAAGGVMLALGLQAYGAMWFLAPFAAAPMVLAQYRFLPRRWSGAALGVMWFVYYLLAYYIAIRQLAPIALALVLAGVMGLIGTFLGSFDRIFNERTAFRFYLLTMPAVWVGWDFFMSDNLVTATEGQIQYMLAPVPLLIQPISVLGAPALAYVMVAFGCALGLGAVRWLDSRSAPVEGPPISASAFRRVFVTAMALTLVWVVASVGLFYQARSDLGPTARIAAIEVGTQTGFDAAGLGEFTPATNAVLEQQSRQAAAQGAQLLVWPEVALNFDPRLTNTEWIPDLARQTGTYIQAAWFYIDADGTQHNSVGMWSPEGDLLGVYNKINSVLIAGEWLDQQVAFPVIVTSVGRIGMLICFDASFHSPSRYLTLGGAQLLTSSNGNWKDATTNRMATAQFRAVENRVGFVKEELITGAAMIDATGTIIAATPIPAGDEMPATYLVADVPLGGGGSIYGTIGDFFGQLCVLGLALRVFFQIHVRRSSR